MAKLCTAGIFLFVILAAASATEEKPVATKKNLAIFEVVKFPNDACAVSGASKNGTCYTSTECEDRGGSSSGSCADGYGVCCVFTVGCGSKSSENSTYFEMTSGINAGPCTSQVCKTDNNICQIRLDFDTFVITGPSTSTNSIGKATFGVVDVTGGSKEVSTTGQCLTDAFFITGARNVPTVCGTLTGEHVYFDAAENCNNLEFVFGGSAVGISATATRSFSIRVTQFSCDYINKAPNGCTQYFYGSSGTGYVKTFNYDSSRHLAEQSQTMCIRRESGNCKVCFSADKQTDVQVSGGTKGVTALVTGTSCCAYGSKGTKVDKQAYDCLVIPGAAKATTKSAQVGATQCGGGAGLQTAKLSKAKSTSKNKKTVCSKSMPFRIEFHSDSYEFSKAAADESSGNKGFKLRYFQVAC